MAPPSSSARPPSGSIGGVDVRLLEDVARRRLELQLDDHAPERQDRAPGAGRVHDLRRPRPGGDHDRAGLDEAIRRDDADRPRARARDPGLDALTDPGATPLREPGERAARGRRGDGEPDVEAHGREAIGEAGLEAAQVVGSDVGGPEVGVADGDGGGLRPERVLVRAEGQDPRRLGAEAEVAAGRVDRQLRGDLVDEGPVARERLAIERTEDGVRRVPHRRPSCGPRRRPRPSRLRRA